MSALGTVERRRILRIVVFRQEGFHRDLSKVSVGEHGTKKFTHGDLPLARDDPGMGRIIATL
jgi:hypothetical protein